jgi:hypothetical protein
MSAEGIQWSIMSFVNDATTWKGAQVYHQVLSVQDMKWYWEQLREDLMCVDIYRAWVFVVHTAVKRIWQISRTPLTTKAGIHEVLALTSSPHLALELSLSSLSRTSLIPKALCSIGTTQNSSKMEKPRLRTLLTSLFPAQHC